MYMTDEEIIRSYREAKDKKEQIRILADLNVCKGSVIKKLLIKAGECVPDLRGRRNPIDVEEKVVASNRREPEEDLCASDSALMIDPLAVMPTVETTKEDEDFMLSDSNAGHLHRALKRFSLAVNLIKEDEEQLVKEEILIFAVNVLEVDLAKEFGVCPSIFCV